jgi:CheY-like chemotaxis protein
MTRSYTILYADDDHEDLKMISEAFEKYTHHLKVAHAYNGTEALQLLRQMCDDGTAPCLIILDINMPKMNGIETLIEIRKIRECQHIPAILFSTSSKLIDKKFAESMGADFITKPAKYVDLEKLVGEFVEKCLIESKT